MFIFVFRRLLDVTKPVDEGQRPSIATAFKSRWAVFGGVAIFLYVGAEVSIGSAMTNFLHEPDMLNMSLEEAGKMVSYYWGGAMVGRLIGSGLLFLVKHAHRGCSLSSRRSPRCLCLAVSQLARRHRGLSRAVDRTVQLHHVPGDLHARRWSVRPRRRRPRRACCVSPSSAARSCRTSSASIADAAGLHTAYFLPALAYALIVVFAVAASNAKTYEHGTAAATAGH